MDKINVLITIDTEHSIGGAFRDPSLKPVGNDKRIFGRINGKEYGIPLIIDIADDFDIRLTFFVEVLNKHYFGEAETCQVCEYILARGHDVQLHLHPVFLSFRDNNPVPGKKPDNMYAYTFEEQVEILGYGKELLSSYTGYEPVAFRAGNYGADSHTLLALAKTGFVMDSSYNRRYHRAGRMNVGPFFNDIGEINGILEIPVTSFVQKSITDGGQVRPMDINGAGFQEMRHVLEQAHASRMSAVTIVMHSFSFIKAFDPQYSKCSIRMNVVKRYTKLCSFLNKNRERFQTSGLQGFARLACARADNNSGSGLPVVPFRYSLSRMADQALGELISGKKFIL
ncbi:hypothetical protein [Desulfonatronovibrio hydrogenovorans]|uniref:hypothetical protein n=1 Tax=Desulfonatronovibrio hydrogenovorans TaxID=53245 RepID=UPI00048DE8CB|nr:hypothetical protein [Desulfonatronovibrio hydrogenovorans]